MKATILIEVDDADKITMTREMNGYWCVICMRFLPSIDGVVIHDDVIHPDNMTFEETEQ